MENAMGRVNVARAAEKSAVRNASGAGKNMKLIAMWLIVGVPLLWGAIKALEDIASIPL